MRPHQTKDIIMNPDNKQIVNGTVFVIGMVVVYFTSKNAERKEAPKRKAHKERMEALIREHDEFLEKLPRIHEHYRRPLINAEFWKIVNHEE